ncbi:hypothetical protein EON66_05095, partial [archaeon]
MCGRTRSTYSHLPRRSIVSLRAIAITSKLLCWLLVYVQVLITTHFREIIHSKLIYPPGFALSTAAASAAAQPDNALPHVRHDVACYQMQVHVERAAPDHLLRIATADDAAGEVPPGADDGAR